VLVERSRYATSDAMGRFRFDSVAPGRYSLSILHAVLDSFDLTSPTRVVDVPSEGTVTVDLATPSAATAYLMGCARRLSEVAKKEDVVAYLLISASCTRISRRAAQQTAVVPTIDSTGAVAPRSQALPAVVVRDSVRSVSPLAMYGFEDRRRMGLGAYVTPEMLATTHYESLPSLLASVRGVRVEYGSTGEPSVYLRGYASPRCIPAVFVDGALYFLPGRGSTVGGGPTAGATALARRSQSISTAFRDLSTSAPPWEVKAIEVYANPGSIPAQFDYTTWTGCGSIVIWTR
jgi:hypothetical protein